MFKNRLHFLHEKIYVVSLYVTFISLFLPWLSSPIFDVNIIGIQTIFGIITVAVLILSAVLSFFIKNKNRLVSILNIIFGILCIVTVGATFIGYNPVMSLIGGIIIFHIGIYIALIGSIGITISGFIGLRKKRKQPSLERSNKKESEE